tara:strand:- start:134 stop:442 length:309 start_codon:yes stop_codon:yes gene_type:complete
MDIDNEINYLAETDDTFALLVAEVDYQRDMIKHFKGAYVTQSDVAVSKATESYYGSESYVNSIKSINVRNLELLKLKNKRRTAEMKIEIWRTLEASRRKGNI